MREPDEIEALTTDQRFEQEGLVRCSRAKTLLEVC